MISNLSIVFLVFVTINFVSSSPFHKNSFEPNIQNDLKTSTNQNRILIRVAKSTFLQRPDCELNSLQKQLSNKFFGMFAIVKRATGSLTSVNDTIQNEDLSTNCRDISSMITENVCSVLKHKNQFTSGQLQRLVYCSGILQEGIHLQMQNPIFRQKRSLLRKKMNRLQIYLRESREFKIKYQIECSKMDQALLSSPFAYSMHIMTFFQKCQTCTSH